MSSRPLHEEEQELSQWEEGKEEFSQICAAFSVPPSPDLYLRAHPKASLLPSNVSLHPHSKPCRGAAGLGSASLPWQGAPGPRERKPAGQAQWNEPAVLSQRPGPQGGGCWAHSSTSSSHVEPRKPAGQTQRKEPGRFSQAPRPQRPGLWVHSSTSAWSKQAPGSPA